MYYINNTGFDVIPYIEGKVNIISGLFGISKIHNITILVNYNKNKYYLK